MSLVVPAVLPYSHKELDEKLNLFSQIPSVNRIQIDIVDGNFASPKSWPYSAPEELREMVERNEMLPQLDHIEYEVDLMCLDSERAVDEWLSLGVSRLTFHAESTHNLPKLLESSRKRYDAGGLAPIISFGVALNIESDLSIVESCFSNIEYVQFMGIAHIGKQSQPFDVRVFEKIRIFHERHPDIPIQVDGGVSLENAKKLLSSGVSSLVIGSAIANAKDPISAIEEFEKLENSYGV